MAVFSAAGWSSLRWWPILAATAVVLGGAVGTSTRSPADEPIVPASFDPEVEITETACRGVGGFPAPLWQSYGLADSLFWARDNQAGNIPLVVAQGTNAPLISAGDPQFAVAEGVRAFYGQRDPCHCGWEIGYFGIYNQTATRSVFGDPNSFVQMPGPIGNVLTADGQTATVRYLSTLNSAEANVFSTRTLWRDRTDSWMTIDWLAGFRYVGFEDAASITMNCCVTDTSERAVNYAVRTRNNMFGAQVGNRTRWTWERWAFESWAKAGLLGNAQEQLQNPLVDYTGFQQRPALSSRGSEVGFVADVNMSVIYRLTSVWGIRAGYNLFWLQGLALAPNQFSFANTSVAGTQLASGGNLFMNGANLGLEARW